MAKRRNLKKEKALRNEAYARKFRKRTQRSRFGGRRNSQQDDKPDDKDKSDDGAASSSTGATDI